MTFPVIQLQIMSARRIEERKKCKWLVARIIHNFTVVEIS